MRNFFKGIVAGLGGVSPGLSGSVLLILMGLYHPILEALASLFRRGRENLRFLLPIVAGMLTGVLLFSKVIDLCLTTWEMPTRFCFLGLILGTIPLFYQQVRQEGFARRYWALILLSLGLGIWLFAAHPALFAPVQDPTLAQSVFLGFAVAATAILPGLDPAAVLSALGYYTLYVHSLADFDISVLLPMVLGLAAGAVVLSKVMTALFRRWYTATFSLLFGLFLSMVSQMLTERCTLGADPTSALSLLLAALGFALSYFLGDFHRNVHRIRAALARRPLQQRRSK